MPAPERPGGRSARPTSCCDDGRDAERRGPPSTRPPERSDAVAAAGVGVPLAGRELYHTHRLPDGRLPSDRARPGRVGAPDIPAADESRPSLVHVARLGRGPPDDVRLGAEVPTAVCCSHWGGSRSLRGHGRTGSRAPALSYGRCTRRPSGPVGRRAPSRCSASSTSSSSATPHPRRQRVSGSTTPLVPRPLDENAEAAT